MYELALSIENLSFVLSVQHMLNSKCIKDACFNWCAILSAYYNIRKEFNIRSEGVD